MLRTKKSQTIAIIGGGAAGCFAAANIPRSDDYEVILFEKTGKLLQKVKVSGGGRCNVTHACFEVPALLEKYPRGRQLLKKTLYQFTPQQTIDWFEALGVVLKTEADGRMFPVTDNSQTIIDALRYEMIKKNVKIHYHKSLQKIEKTGDAFHLHFMDGTVETANKILISCGGYPKEESYNWLKNLGHTIQTPVPSLFTFNLAPDSSTSSVHSITELSGIAVNNATVKVNGTKFSETAPLLITHWGLSGPAVLRTSAWAARILNEKNYHFHITVNWLEHIADAELREMIAELRKNIGKQLMVHKNPFGLPKRLWEYVLNHCNVKPETRWGELPAQQQNKLVECLVRDTYEVKGKTTFKEEFVTCGGISITEINPQKMESRIVPGLFFAGEIIDVDGITGGFNFQQAWSSAWIVAKFITNKYESD